MTTPTDAEFIDQTTVITEAWLDGINDWVYGWYGVMGETFTAAAARAAFAVPSTSDIQAQTATAFTTGGTSTAFTLDVTPNISAYAAGQRFRVKFNATAGAAPTLNIDAVGAVDLKLYDSLGAKVAASATTIISGMLTDVEYDGTDMVILNQLPPAALSSVQSSGYAISAGGTFTWTHALGTTPKIIMATLVCLTGEQGYTAGQRVAVPFFDVGGTTSRGVSLLYGATTIVGRFGSTATVFNIPHATTGTASAATNGNWELVLDAIG